MRSRTIIVIGARIQKRRWASVMVAVLAALALAPLTSTPATAAGAPSTLCSGYQGCSVGDFTTHGYQNASGQSFWTMYAGNNCTNYVAYVESSTYQVPTPTYDLGNGGEWATAAAQHGVVVNDTPSVGAVAEWTGGASGMTSSGHVAVVEAVGPGDSYVVVSQQHIIGPDGYDWIRIMRDSAANQWEDWPSGFIHFTSPSLSLPQIAARSNIQMTVTPKRFSGYKFVLAHRSDRIVKAGPVNGLVDGSYAVSLENAALQADFALSVHVAGRSVRVLARGSMLEAAPTPRFALSRAAPRTRERVIITIRRIVSATPTTSSTPTTTTTPTATTTTVTPLAP